MPIAPVAAHLPGEVLSPLTAAARALPDGPLPVDTLGRRFHVQWDPHAAVTPLGQLVFFAQFLAAGGLFAEWVRTCPLRFTSPNAPLLPDLLGTILLAVLSGHNRYAHVTKWLKPRRVKFHFVSGRRWNRSNETGRRAGGWRKCRGGAGWHQAKGEAFRPGQESATARSRPTGGDTRSIAGSAV